jgi:hypothetical protein
VLQVFQSATNDFKQFTRIANHSTQHGRNTAVQFSFAVTGGVIASPRHLRFGSGAIGWTERLPRCHI